MGPSGHGGAARSEVVRIWLLGGFRVAVGSRTIENGRWRLRKAAALVKLLALSRGHHLQREQVMDLFWPDLGRRAASNNLRGVIHSARKVLEPGTGTAARCLRFEGERISLCPEGQLWVNVDIFEEAAATARRIQEPAAYLVPVELYSGELLPEDRYEEWAEDRREGLRQLHLALLVELAGLYEERGGHGQAIEVLRRVVAEEPALEEAHASLMRLYVLSGQRGEALAQYGRLRQGLSGQLGAEPGVETRLQRLGQSRGPRPYRKAGGQVSGRCRGHGGRRDALPDTGTGTAVWAREIR